MNRADLAWIMHQWEESSRPREGFQDARSLNDVKQNFSEKVAVSDPLLARIVLEDVLSCIRVIQKALENRQTLGEIVAKLKTGQLEIPVSLSSLTPQKVERRFCDDTIRTALARFQKDGQAAAGTKEDKSYEGHGKVDDEEFFEKTKTSDETLETSESEPKGSSMSSIGEGEGKEKEKESESEKEKAKTSDEMKNYVSLSLAPSGSASANANANAFQTSLVGALYLRQEQTKKRHICERDARGYCRAWSVLPGTLNGTTPVCSEPIEAHTFGQEIKYKEATLHDLEVTNEEYNQVFASFISRWGSHPAVVDKVISIQKVTCCDALTSAYETTLKRLEQKWKEFDKKNEFPKPLLLYHGTHDDNVSKISTRGLAIPTNYAWGDHCTHKPPGADLKRYTSLCLKDCHHCLNPGSPHSWALCHMYGMGIYFADQSSKANQYIHKPSGTDQKKSRRLLVFSVITGRTFPVTQLENQYQYHDYVLPPPNHDCIKAVGDKAARRGFGVLNDEWTIFNPTQALLKYIITYDCK